jgi:TonB family protein
LDRERMSDRLEIVRRRAKRHSPMRTRKVGAAFESPARGGAVAIEFPGLGLAEPEGRRRTLVSGSFAAGIHFGAIGLLMLLASLAPVIEEELIPVQLLKEQQKRDEPAPAPKALAERRSATYAPAVQSFQPQVINPRVIAEAAPAVSAEALQMDSVSSVAAPTQISRSATVVERVSAVNSIVAARASAVDVKAIGGSVVRGPIQVEGPVGPSVGPRQVAVATGAPTMGTGTLSIGSGSSVKEGVVTGRDVLGSPDGAPLVSIDTSVGEGNLRGSGGEGSSVLAGGSGSETADECFQKAEVRQYLADVEARTLSRWVLPPGVKADQRVTLQFKLDVAGSATSVSLKKASDNALGASAVDALRAAAPFPPMPNGARCLALVPITATFTNPLAG